MLAKAESMSILDPTLVARAPELAVLNVLSDTLTTAIVALAARYPDMHGDHPLHWCSSTPSACCFANTIIEDLYALDIALAHYCDFIEDELRPVERDQRIT